MERWLALAPYPRGRFGPVGAWIRRACGPRSVKFEDQIEVPFKASDAERSWWYGYWQSPSRVGEVLADMRASMCGALPPIQGGTIGIHVRRGDYVANDMILSPNYYRIALKSLVAANGLDVKSTRITVFSDDVAWCQRELQFDFPVVYSPPRDTRDDFLSLLSSDYLVLSRSTFSWWAGVLPDRPRQHVISPYPFVPPPLQPLDYPGWLRQTVS
ncbi:alpha-1,2-fucosyltransferase [Arthrobacter sp. B2I5]|uniref:alpha-1,2-fucosyltransferase n=1 Tax=Arthrobacter sp. B2I5 TaxID=3042266 RepID=UPI00358ED524